MVVGPTARRSSSAVLVLRLLGAVLLLAVAVIHGYLWQQGYRDIDVIGPAFSLQIVLGAGAALLLLVAPPRLLLPVAALGALFSAGSLAALVLSTTVGLFGFQESTAAPLWWESFWVETGGVAVLTGLAVLAARRRARG